MPSSRKPAAKGKASSPAKSQPALPSPTVMKLQILGAVVIPMLLVGIWLQRQGFW